MSAKEERRERAREQILEAAAGAIARAGYHGMSMRALARATGRSLANFYNYFASKEDVLFGIQSRAFETLIASAQGLLAEADEPAAKLYLFIANHVGFFMQHTDVMRVLVHEASALPAKQRRVVRKLKERYFHIARDVVTDILDADGRKAGRASPLDEVELECATYNVFGMINWVYGWYDAKRHGSPHTVLRSIHRMAMRALVAGMPLDRLHEAMAAQLVADARLPSPIRRGVLDRGRAA